MRIMVQFKLLGRVAPRRSRRAALAVAGRAAATGVAMRQDSRLDYRRYEYSLVAAGALVTTVALVVAAVGVDEHVRGEDHSANSNQ